MNANRPSNSLCVLQVWQGSNCGAEDCKRIVVDVCTALWAIRAEYMVSWSVTGIVTVGLQDVGFSIQHIPRRVVARGSSCKMGAPWPVEKSGLYWRSDFSLLPTREIDVQIERVMGLSPTGEARSNPEVKWNPKAVLKVGSRILEGRLD